MLLAHGPGLIGRPAVDVTHVLQTNWFASWDTAKAPAGDDWKNTHSLLRFVNFDTVQIAEAIQVKTPDWGVSLVDSPETPLLIAGQRDRRRLPPSRATRINVVELAQRLAHVAPMPEEKFLRPGRRQCRRIGEKLMHHVTEQTG